MDESLLSDLTKKDSDFKVISTDAFGGSVVETSLDIGYEIIEEEEVELPEPLGIPTRIIRHVLVINVAITFFFALFGIVPYYLLTVNVPRIIPLVLLGASGAVCLLLHGLMHFLRRHERGAAPTLVTWIFVTFVFVFSLSASLQSLAPFQACTILFIEYIAALLYCLLANSKEVNGWWCAATMMISGLIIWGLGMFSFVREQDWITSALLFLICVLLGPFYSSFEIHRMAKRYNLEELTRANIEFFTDVYGVFGLGCNGGDTSEASVTDGE